MFPQHGWTCTWEAKARIPVIKDPRQMTATRTTGAPVRAGVEPCRERHFIAMRRQGGTWAAMLVPRDPGAGRDHEPSRAGRTDPESKPGAWSSCGPAEPTVASARMAFISPRGEKRKQNGQGGLAANFSSLTGYIQTGTLRAGAIIPGWRNWGRSGL